MSKNKNYKNGVSKSSMRKLIQKFLEGAAFTVGATVMKIITGLLGL